ncbi:MAG: tetratricopeptide repeat protein [Desulfuromonadales bacterium]
MKKETILLLVVTLVVGTLIGTIIASKPTKTADKDDHDTHVAQTPAVNTQKELQILKEVLEKEPANRNAWVQLGNKYFDTNQPMESIEAYDKALAIDDNDPNVLTDQGIMYRSIGWFDKAIENFGKANKLAPRHTQSLLNMGIVYRFDLEQNDKAKEAWLKYLEIDPTGETADRVRTMIEHVEKGHS